MVQFIGGGTRLEFLDSTVHSYFTGPNTATVPNGVKAGDLLVLCDAATSQFNFTGVFPSGFTGIKSLALLVGTPQLFALYSSFRIVQNDAEAGTTVTGLGNAQTRSVKTMLAFRPKRPLTAANVFGTPGGLFTSNSDLPPQTIEASEATAPGVALGFWFWVGAEGLARTMTIDGEDVIEGGDGDGNGGVWGFVSFKTMQRTADLADVVVDHPGSSGNVAAMESAYLQLTL